MTAWELLLRDFQDSCGFGGGGGFFFFFFKGKVDHCSLPTWSVVSFQCCLLAGYIIHDSVTEGGDRGWRGAQGGTAIFEQSLALQRHSCFETPPPPPPSSVCCWCRRSFEKSLEWSYGSGELGDCGIGFVSVLCLVFVLFLVLGFCCFIIYL